MPCLRHLVTFGIPLRQNIRLLVRGFLVFLFLESCHPKLFRWVGCRSSLGRIRTNHPQSLCWLHFGGFALGLDLSGVGRLICTYLYFSIFLPWGLWLHWRFCCQYGLFFEVF